MRNMEDVVPTSDPSWPSAATLLTDRPVEGRRNVGLIGVSTYATSVTPRSSTSTPPGHPCGSRALLHVVFQ